MRIIFIHPDLGIGGAERLVLDVAVALQQGGDKVSFLTNHCDRKHAFDEIKNDQFPVHVVGNWLPRSLFGRCSALCAYVRMLYLSLAYILFLKGNVPADLCFVDQIPVAIPFLKLSGKKVVYYCHHPDLLASPPGGFWKKLYRYPLDWIELKCTKQADVLLVNSEYTATVFKQTFPEIEGPLRVLYPTIARTHTDLVASVAFRPIAEIVPRIVPEARHVFLSINRFHPAKKLELAIEAADALRPRLSKADWDAFVLIVAGGYDPHSAINAEYFRRLQQLAEERALGGKIVFVKSPSDLEKAELLCACTCLLYTPVNEHFGIVPLEAMSAGKPVIACDSGGPKETVEDGVNGYLCEAEGSSFAASMKRLIVEKGRAEEMGQRGKERLERRFSYESFEREIRSAIEAVPRL